MLFSILYHLIAATNSRSLASVSFFSFHNLIRWNRKIDESTDRTRLIHILLYPHTLLLNLDMLWRPYSSLWRAVKLTTHTFTAHKQKPGSSWHSATLITASRIRSQRRPERGSLQKWPTDTRLRLTSCCRGNPKWLEMERSGKYSGKVLNPILEKQRLLRPQQTGKPRVWVHSRNQTQPVSEGRLEKRPRVSFII